MKLKHSILFLGILLIAACTKQGNQVKPAATTGSFSGRIVPAGAVVKMIATLTGDSVAHQVAIDSSTGNFKLSGLKAGAYNLAFQTDPRYARLNQQAVSVVIGQNTDVGIINVKDAPYTLYYYVDGKFEGWFFQSTYYHNYFQIEPESIGSYPEDMRVIYFPAIGLTMAKPGTFTCNGPTGAFINYTAIRMGSGFPVARLSTRNKGGSGTLVVTSIDTLARKITATFS